MTAQAADYVPKSVLLTGGCGFIGSNVALRLIASLPDTRFVVFDKVDYCATLNNLKPVWNHANFSFVQGDICDASLVRYVIKMEQIDTIMNFAAQTHVDNSFGTSFEFTRTNVMGTHVLLEAAKQAKDQIRRFIHVSTDEVYGQSDPNSDVAFHELSQLNPTNPYSASKACAEFLVKAYATSFNLPIIITRGNNVYGPRQFPEKLIPKFISLMERDRPLPIHGKGAALRSFLFVDDVSAAFELVLRRGEVGEIYNIGTSEEKTVLEVARAILKLFGRHEQEDKYLQFVRDRDFNDARYNIALTKLADLGWKGPATSFEEGLQQTLEWYKAHPDHWVNLESALVAHPRIGTGSVPKGVPTGDSDDDME